MRIIRKRWVPLAAAGILIILLVALYFTAAWLVNSGWLRSLAKTEIDKALEGTVQFEKTSLLVFPRLGIRVHQVSFNRPDLAAGAVKKIDVYPRILFILKGEFRIARAVLDEPDIITAPPRKKEPPFTPETIRQKIIPALIQISNRSPGATLRVVNGKLNMQRAGGTSFIFTGVDLDAGITREELSLDLASAASPWGALKIQGRFSYAEDKLAAKALSVSAGGSSLSGTEASLVWEGDMPVISAEVDQAGIDLKDLRDWGVFSKLRKGLLKNINSVEGRINLSSVNMDGPLQSPSEWDYSFSGDLDHVALHTELAGQVVKLDAGRFSAAHDRQSPRESTIEAIGIQGSIGKSSFENVSALLKGTGDGTFLQAGADAVALDLNEIQKWRIFQDFRKNSLGILASLNGSARVEKLEAEGPLKSPAKWKYNLSGSLDNIVFALTGAPYEFEIPKGAFSATGSASEKDFAFSGVSGKFGSSSFSGISGKFRTDGTPRLEISGGKTRLALNELEGWEYLNERLGPDLSLAGSVLLDFFRFTGALPDPATWAYAASGEARNVTVETPDFPASKLDGRFSLDQDTLSLEKARAALLDTTLSLTGAIRVLDNKFSSAALDIAGTVGRGTLTWASQYQPIPEYIKVPASISVRNSRLEWKNPKEFSLKGVMTPEEGPRIDLDLARNPSSWEVRDFHVKDALSDAGITLKIAKDGTDFYYTGKLHKKTVDSLIVNELEENAFIAGKLSGHVPVKNPILASVTGRVSAGDILIPLTSSSYPLKIESITLKADPDNYLIESAGLSWGNQNFTTTGAVVRKGDFLELDLNVLTDLIVYERLQAMITEMQSAAKDQDKSKPSKFWELPLRGNVTVSSDRFIIRKYTAEPFSVDIALGPRLVRLNFTKDFICGMPLPGTIDITPVGTGMNFRSVTLNMDLAPVLACLFSQETAASGSFDFNGEVTASGDLPETMKGEFTFTARRGLIYRARLLSSILEYLNITQIFLGRLPTIGAEGLPYRLVSIKGRINGARIEISEFELRGPTLGLAGEGFIDLARNRVELTVLVSPLRTFDYLISRIPVVKYFFKGILAIPVGVYGNPSSPIIVPLDPSAIGVQLYSIMNRIISAPLKLFESFK